MIFYRCMMVFILIGQIWLPNNQNYKVDCPPYGYTLRTFPDGNLQVGDWLSLEFVSPANVNLGNSVLSVFFAGQKLTEAGLTKGDDGIYRATLMWFWNTSGLEPGVHTLEIQISPDGPSWIEKVTLYPPASVSQVWKSIEIPCCMIHYISGTKVEKDLEFIVTKVEERAAEIDMFWGVDMKEKLIVNLVPRFIGQGGFTSDEVYVSYPENDYLQSDLAQIIEHELVHMIDSRRGGDIRPSLFTEGMAVYLSGGHYQKEPLFAKAAAAYHSGWYIPLSILTSDFYPAQHEISYQEAGALVKYMSLTWGWERFEAFYRDIHPVQGDENDVPAAINMALQKHFKITLTQLEDQFQHALERQPDNPDLNNTLRLTVLFYDTMRDYQKRLNPTAYFRQMWIPSARVMRSKGIVSDYLRFPVTPANRQVEIWLAEAHQSLVNGNMDEAELTLGAIQTYLTTLPQPGCALMVRNGQQIKRSLDYLSCVSLPEGFMGR
jgi:hypothetical protein